VADRRANEKGISFGVTQDKLSRGSHARE
jgi:hypothetical protein